MAKTELMRPSWVCLKLCSADTIAATLLAEIFFKANITKYERDGNPLIVFSYDEWADISGLSIGQVRKALKRLADFNLVKFYNKMHPHKIGVLRALHVEVPLQLWKIYGCLTCDGYKFQRDVLSTKNQHQELTISVAGLGYGGLYDVGSASVSSAVVPVCTEGADVSIYNNISKNSIKPAAQNDAAGMNKKSEKEEDNIAGDDWFITDSLKSIKTLPSLLIEVHHHHLKHFSDYIGHFCQKDADMMKLWSIAVKQYYEEPVNDARDITTGGLFILLREEIGDNLPALITKVVSHWDYFTEHVSKQHASMKAPLYPNVEFFYYYRAYALSFNVVEQDSTEVTAA